MIGYQRFTIWSLHRLISLRTYHGTVSYQRAHVQPLHHPANAPLPPNGNHGGYRPSYPAQHLTSSATGGSGGGGGIRPMIRHSMSCGNQLDCAVCNGEGDCETCDTGFGDGLSLETQMGPQEIYRSRADSYQSAKSRASYYYSTADSLYKSVAEKQSNGGVGGDGLDEPDSSRVPAQMYGPASRLPALTAPVPDNWTVERGEFIMVHASYQTHISSDCYFAPQSQLDDGIIWLCVIRGGATRQELLKFLLGMSNGTHLSQQGRFIEMIPVTAFRIEPDTAESMGGVGGVVGGVSAAASAVAAAEKQHGHFTVDGERVEYGPIQGEVVQGLAQVMAPIYTT